MIPKHRLGIFLSLAGFAFVPNQAGFFILPEA
jgi:hypothetical protein